MALGFLAGLGGLLAQGIVGLKKQKIERQLVKKVAAAQEAAEALARFKLPEIKQATEEAIYRRGIQDSSIAARLREEASLRTQAALARLEAQAAQRQAVQKSRKLQKLGTMLGLGGAILGELTLPTVTPTPPSGLGMGVVATGKAMKETAKKATRVFF